MEMLFVDVISVKRFVKLIIWFFQTTEQVINIYCSETVQNMLVISSLYQLSCRIKKQKAQTTVYCIVVTAQTGLLLCLFLFYMFSLSYLVIFILVLPSVFQKACI